MQQLEDTHHEPVDLTRAVVDHTLTQFLHAETTPAQDAAVAQAFLAVLTPGLGVGGTPGSAARAGRLGLPMILGYIGGGGFTVTPEQFRDSVKPDRHLMIGPSEYVTEKLADLVERLRLDRIQALVDWGGLPEHLVEDSVARLALDIAPQLRKEH